jgi:hypothetical protein
MLPSEGAVLHFLAGVILVVGFVALLIGSPAFRWAVLVIVGIIAVGIFAIVEAEKSGAERRRQQQAQEASFEAARWQRISADSVSVRDSTLSTSSVGQRTLTLDIKNQSSLAITGLRAVVRLYDCPRGTVAIDSSCETIGDASGSLYGDIPPDQARQLTGRFTFQNEPRPKGQLRWSMEIKGVRS